MEVYDSIVIGLGGMGSATACELARRGQRVLGLEQHAFGHALGSSQGQTRIIRQAYFEHPDYVPLLRHAYAQWESLAEPGSNEILNLCGLVLSGREEDAIIAGTRQAADKHGLPLENVAPREVTERYPGLQFDDGATILFDPLGGYLRVENCVMAHIRRARAVGATLLEYTPVREWHTEGAKVEVVTDKARYRAANLIICAGSWTDRLLQSLKLPLTVRRVVTAWFPTENPAHHVKNAAPVFAYQTDAGFFYGFPQLDQRGVKIACHDPGDVVANPDTVDRVVTAQDLSSLQAFSSRYVNGLNAAPLESNACLYTMTPDGHFIVDRHPEHDNVVFAAGFSGHGFKFCPAIGTILSDLVTVGASSLPSDFLGLKRLDS